jgi:hypothetical protein
MSLWQRQYGGINNNMTGMGLMTSYIKQIQPVTNISATERLWTTTQAQLTAPNSENDKRQITLENIDNVLKPTPTHPALEKSDKRVTPRITGCTEPKKKKTV